MQMLQKKGICVASEGFFKQSSFSCKTSAAIILIKYMENIQTQLPKAALYKPICHEKHFSILLLFWGWGFFPPQKTLYGILSHSMFYRRHSTNLDVKTSVFCKSLITHSAIYLSAVWKVILLFWRKSNLNINPHLHSGQHFQRNQRRNQKLHFSDFQKP